MYAGPKHTHASASDFECLAKIFDPLLGPFTLELSGVPSSLVIISLALNYIVLQRETVREFENLNRYWTFTVSLGNL